MKRRDMLVSLAATGAGAALSACASAPDDDLQAAARQLGTFELKPGEGPAVLASLKGSRYTVDVDPTIQPQSDFDPDAP